MNANLRDAYKESSGSSFLNAEITLLDAAGAIAPINDGVGEVAAAPVRKKTVDEVWREIVEGKRGESKRRAVMKEAKAEAMDEMMTLEDFLVKAGAVEEAATADEGAEVKVEVDTEMLSGRIFSFDSSSMGASPLQSGGGSEGMFLGQSVEGVMAYGNGMEGMGRIKRRGSLLEQSLDKAAQQRQRRMIKNRESAARSRERKQAYQVELETMAVRLEEENERLLKEKADRTKERFKQLMEKVIPVVEKRRPARLLRRVRSMDC